MKDTIILILENIGIISIILVPLITCAYLFDKWSQRPDINADEVNKRFEDL